MSCALTLLRVCPKFYVRSRTVCSVRVSKRYTVTFSTGSICSEVEPGSASGQGRVTRSPFDSCCSTRCQLLFVTVLFSIPLVYLVIQDILLDNFLCYRGSLGCVPGGNVLHRIAVKEEDDWTAACRHILTWQAEQLEIVKHKATVGLSIQDMPEDGEHLRVDRAGRLPLHIAAQYGNVGVVEVRAYSKHQLALHLLHFMIPYPQVHSPEFSVGSDVLVLW
eukprot:9498301-Pyramimonas_sp.AAC.1